MNNDRELLEQAARAAGHTIEFDEASGLTWYESKFTGVLWNPLHHDGDALRLAVKLKMDVLQKEEGSTFATNHRLGAREFHDDDPYAATRRAIVRAAAEIGKTL